MKNTTNFFQTLFDYVMQYVIDYNKHVQWININEKRKKRPDEKTT